MQHSVSMSYMSMGSTNLMLNTYLNTMQYEFSDNLLLTTKLGIMNSPYNSMPHDNYLNESRFFGGAELLYKPTENMIFSISFESVPYLMRNNNNSYYHRNPLGLGNYDW